MPEVIKIVQKSQTWPRLFATPSLRLENLGSIALYSSKVLLQYKRDSQMNSWRLSFLDPGGFCQRDLGCFPPPREFLFSRLFAARNYPKLMFIIPPRVFVALPGEK